MNTDTREVAPTCTACGSEHNGESALCFSCKPTNACIDCRIDLSHTSAVGERCLACYVEGVCHGGDVETIDDVEASCARIIGRKLTALESGIVTEIARDSYGMRHADFWK